MNANISNFVRFLSVLLAFLNAFSFEEASEVNGVDLSAFVALRAHEFGIP
jgi:hypothetical protein